MTARPRPCHLGSQSSVCPSLRCIHLSTPMAKDPLPSFRSLWWVVAWVSGSPEGRGASVRGPEEAAPHPARPGHKRTPSPLKVGVSGLRCNALVSVSSAPAKGLCNSQIKAKQGNALFCSLKCPAPCVRSAKILLCWAARIPWVPRGGLAGRCLNEEKIGYKST